MKKSKIALILYLFAIIYTIIARYLFNQNKELIGILLQVVGFIPSFISAALITEDFLLSGRAEKWWENNIPKNWFTSIISHELFTYHIGIGRIGGTGVFIILWTIGLSPVFFGLFIAKLLFNL